MVKLLFCVSVGVCLIVPEAQITSVIGKITFKKKSLNNFQLNEKKVQTLHSNFKHGFKKEGGKKGGNRLRNSGYAG